MMDEIGAFKIETFPASRVSTIDVGIMGKKKHHMAALIELDVTEARKSIREARKTSKNISFNAWLIKCVSQAVSECKSLHGIRKGKRSVVIFEEVDISIVIEREVDGMKVPLPYVIRKTNEKSVEEIYEEIQSGKSQPITGEADYVLGRKENKWQATIYYRIPGFLRRLAWKYILANPMIIKKNMGTVMMTMVGMMGRINGWVLPVSIHPLSFAVGSIIKKPGVVDNRIEIREFLQLTVLVDHDVVDGAPAVRALTSLSRMIERGYK